MNIHMRKSVAFLLAFAMIVLAAMLPISSMAATCSVCGGDGFTGENNDVPCTASGCKGGVIPDPEPDKNPPADTTGKNPPVNTTGVNPPAGTTVTNPSAGATITNPPVGTTVENSPAGQTVENPPVGQTVENPPVGQTVENPPAGTTVENPPEEPSRPEGCTCAEGEPHDAANEGCALYAPPQINRPEGCTCPEGESHNDANESCALYIAPQPEPKVETTADVTYGEPTLGSVDVSVVWEEDVPVDTALTFALQYARENDSQGNGVTQPLTVTNPAKTATFTNVPVSVVKTTVTTTTTTPYDADTATWLTDQQTSTSETSEETIGYVYVPISASAGAGYRVAKDGLSLHVSVRSADDVDETTNAVITFHWNNIPEDQDPKVSIRLLSNGTAVNNSETTLGKGASSFGYYGLPLKDADGNEISYTVSAGSAASSVDGGFTVSAEGLTVTVNWLDDEAVTSVLSEITTLIGTLPETIPEVDANQMTYFGNLSDVRATLSQIKELLRELTSTQRADLDSGMMSRYNAWSEFVENVSYASNRDNEGEPSNHPITISGSVTFTPAATDPVAPPSSVVVNLLQDGAVVRSLGVTIASNTGTFTFGEWPQYNGANGKTYIYSVCGTSVTGYVASTGSSYAVTYSAATNTATDKTFPVTVTFVTTGATGADATPEATVQMYKNDNPVSGQSFKFTTTNGLHTFTIPVKGGDVVRPLAPAVNKYMVAVNGLAITYTYVGNTTTFSGTINWVNASRYSKPSLLIVIEGTLKDSVTGKPATVTESITTQRMDEDSTTFIFSELDADYNYKIKNASIPSPTGDDKNYTVSNSETSVTVTRTTDPLVRIGVSMRWIDQGNKREHRPNETTVYLYRDGNYTGDAVQISEASGWYAVFNDQPYNNGAHFYKYTVRAAKTPYYWSRTTRLSNYGFLVTQFIGKKSYDQPATSSAAPKVGDPTLFRTDLTDMMRREAAISAEAIAALAGVTENAAVTESAAVDFDTLKRINGDVVGWISLPGTSIDDPIVHGSNNTKYLSRLFSGEANSAGSIFMDYHNSGKFTSKNTIIYGHNMQNGTMFNALLSYRNQSFYDANKSISLQTPNGDYSLEPVAGFFTEEGYTNVAKYSFSTNAAFLTYVDKCIDNSDFQSETSVSATDKLVTLVTCSNDYDDGTRYLLVCKLTALG